MVHRSFGKAKRPKQITEHPKEAKGRAGHTGAKHGTSTLKK